MTTLYKCHANGKLGTWTIETHGNEIHMITQLSQGATRTTRVEVVHGGKGGRTQAQQIESRINSRINKKLDTGYKRNLREIDTRPTNTLSMPMPMLASRKMHRLDTNSLYVQPKLDGMRLIITRQQNEVFAYSRQGKRVDTISHILEDASTLLDEGEFLDGELYAHGASLQTIMSLAKRSQEDTAKLKFHVFDTIDGAPFEQRFGVLRSRYNEMNELFDTLQTIELVHTTRITGIGEVSTLMGHARKVGYEGLILRAGDAFYTPGKRSNQIVKVKQFFDEEYIVIGVERSIRGVPVLVLGTPEGKPFRATAPGNHGARERAITHPEEFVGELATIMHVGLTGDGKPFQPICKGIRER